MAKVAEGNPYYYCPQKYKIGKAGQPDYSTDKNQICCKDHTRIMARNVTREDASLIVDALNFYAMVRMKAEAQRKEVEDARIIHEKT